MKITLTLNGDAVELNDGAGTGRAMPLDQYMKHARDPDFVAAIDPADHAKVLAAIAKPAA
jgi:hypothetical protein